MIMDELLEFADDTAIPTATGKGLLGDVVDLVNARDVGNGKPPVYLVIEITQAVTSAGAATVAFVLASDAQAAIATDGSATEHVRTAAFAKATLVAGFTIIAQLPPEGSNKYEEFIGVLAEVGTAALTAGKANAFLVHDASAWKANKSAVFV